MGFFNKLFGYDEPFHERAGSVGSAGGDSPLVVPPPRLPNVELTTDTALSIGPVYRSVDIITTMVSGLSWSAYKDGIELGSQPALVKRPSLNDPLNAFLEETTYSLAVYGNAYWLVTGKSPYESLQVLAPERMTLWRDDNNRVHYNYDGKELDAKRVKHLKFFRKPGHLYGYGPIQLCQSELLASLKLRAYADNWFSGSGVPTGYLSTNMPMNADMAQDYIDAWKAFVEKNNIAVLGDDLKYVHLNISPKDAMYVEVQLGMVVNIARIFGIPAMHLLAELTGTSNTYFNLEQSNLVFLQQTLSKYMTEIEQALSSLLPRGTEVRFNESDLLRLDEKTKWDTRKLQADIGYTNGDELRKNDGKEPLEANENE